MKKKLPSIDRRPTGLKSVVEKAILKRCENATADEIANAIENETSHPALDANAKFPPAWVWWCVAQREMTQDAESELDDGSFSNVANALVARYVYGSFRDEVFDRKAKDWISIRALDNLEAVNMPLDDKGKPVPAFEILKTDRRTARVHNERYKPGQSKEVFFEDGVHWLNTWEKPDLKPVQGNAKPMLDHILYLCNGNKEHAGHLADWLAYQVQNPGKKINHAVLLISQDQGTGKDTVYEAMARVLGRTNTMRIQDTDCCASSPQSNPGAGSSAHPQLAPASAGVFFLKKTEKTFFFVFPELLLFFMS